MKIPVAFFGGSNKVRNIGTEMFYSILGKGRAH